MSGKFSSTTNTFATPSLVKQEQYFREIAQQEFLGMFDDIKIEIQTKIKSIDKNIIEIRKEINKIKDQNKQQQNLSEVLEKI